MGLMAQVDWLSATRVFMRKIMFSKLRDLFCPTLKGFLELLIYPSSSSRIISPRNELQVHKKLDLQAVAALSWLANSHSLSIILKYDHNFEKQALFLFCFDPNGL